MSKFKVYVDALGILCTREGSRIRVATPAEVEESNETYEGYIVCPDDVVDRLFIDPDDGETRIKV